VGFFDSLLGRSKPARPDLDQLFQLPTAAITLQAAAGFQSTGMGSVCYRAAQGSAFATTQSDVQALLDADDGPDVELSTDSYGYTWLLVRQTAEQLTDATAMSTLATDLHAVNSTLEINGFGPQLLCSLVAFRDAQGRALGLVYLYKQGTFYPFAPTGANTRDNVLEIQVKSLVGADLAIEPDTSRWFPVWGAPGLVG
jgi:hypothetical protein